MKILHISPILLHPCFTYLINEQKKADSVTFVRLALTDEDKPYKIVKAPYGVCIENVRNSLCYQNDYKLIDIFDRLIKIYKPQLIHVQAFWGVSVASILNVASSLGIKKILTLHDHSLFCVTGWCVNEGKKCSPGSLSQCDCRECGRFAKTGRLSLADFNRVRKARAVELIQQSDRIICPSYHQRDLLVRLFNEKDRFLALHYGVKPLPHAESPKRGGAGIVFGYLGSLSDIKGVSLIETALDKLKSYDFNILMGVTYDPGIKSQKQYFDRLKKNKKVRFRLNINRKELYADFFSSIDYLIIPSLWDETGPMTLFESFYCRVPVLMSDNQSMKEKIKGNKSSRVFSDADGLIRLMKDIVTNKIRKKARDRFPVKSIQEYAKEVSSVYAQALAARPRGLFLRLGLVCNNNCVFCVTGNLDSKEAFDFEAVGNIMVKNKNRYDFLVLTGGEPTIRKDFLRILDLAYRLGYRVTLQTNARMFAFEKFCSLVRRYNMKFSININGPNSEIHDAATRTPGSFEQTLTGIRNLQKMDARILVKILVTKINTGYLSETARFVAGLGIKKIWFVFLTPFGSARDNFDDIVPRYRDAAPAVAEAVAWLRKNTDVKIGMEGFPYCCLPSGFHPLVTEEAFTENSLDGLIPENDRRIYNCKKVRVNNQKQKFDSCRQCPYTVKCEGVYKEYVKRMGTEEFIFPLFGGNLRSH